MYLSLKDKAIMVTTDVDFEGLFYEVRRVFRELPHGGKLLFRNRETAVYFNSYFNSTADANDFKSNIKGNVLEKVNLYQKEPDLPTYPFVVLELKNP